VNERGRVDSEISGRARAAEAMVVSGAGEVGPSVERIR
jgi:hypothetical protein